MLSNDDIKRALVKLNAARGALFPGLDSVLQHYNISIDDEV